MTRTEPAKISAKTVSEPSSSLVNPSPSMTVLLVTLEDVRGSDVVELLEPSTILLASFCSIVGKVAPYASTSIRTSSVLSAEPTLLSVLNYSKTRVWLPGSNLDASICT